MGRFDGLFVFSSQDDTKIPDENIRLILARLLSAIGDQDLAAEELRSMNFGAKDGVVGIDTMYQQADLLFQAGNDPESCLSLPTDSCFTRLQ